MEGIIKVSSLSNLFQHSKHWGILKRFVIKQMGFRRMRNPMVQVLCLRLSGNACQFIQ